jgi:large subunit ribosomal protein L9
MEVILKQDVSNLGRIGDLVRVKPGYARNFLLPRELAVIASTAQKASFEHQKRLIEAHKKKVQKNSQEKAKDFEGVRLTIERRVNESGKMFGSVTANDVSDLLKEKSYNFEKSDIELEAIRAAGNYTVKLRLPGDVFAEVTLEVKGVVEAEKRAKKTATKKSAAKTQLEAGAVEEADASEAVAVPLKRKKSKKAETAEEATTKEPA